MLPRSDQQSKGTQDGGHQELRPYQVEGVKWLLEHDKSMLCDEMGLGKSVQVLEAIKYWVDQHDHLNFRILILCSGSGLYVWQEEITKWWPAMIDSVQEISGQPGVRKAKIRETFTWDKC
ncbi:hypothetical protein LCGC14_2692040, partial [marine sediment metagenome]